MCLFIYFHCTGLLCTLNMAFEIRLVTLLYNRCINVGKDVYIMYVCMFADMCACVYLTLAPFFSLYVRLRVNCGADVLRVNSIKPKRKRYSRFDAFSMRSLNVKQGNTKCFFFIDDALSNPPRLLYC